MSQHVPLAAIDYTQIGSRLGLHVGSLNPIDIFRFQWPHPLRYIFSNISVMTAH